MHLNELEKAMTTAKQTMTTQPEESPEITFGNPVEVFSAEDSGSSNQFGRKGRYFSFGGAVRRSPRASKRRASKRKASKRKSPKRKASKRKPALTPRRKLAAIVDGWNPPSFRF